MIRSRKIQRSFPAALTAVVCWLTATAWSQMGTVPPMALTSTKFSEGGKIPIEFTSDGENVSPDLQIANIPTAAKSLLLIVDDPDAPAGIFTHWLMWNLKPDLREILVNSPPHGAVQGTNDFGKKKYSGPCPPSDTHRYYFRLYALDMVPNLPAGAYRKTVDTAIQEHILSRAILMGLYARAPK